MVRGSFKRSENRVITDRWKSLSKEGMLSPASKSLRRCRCGGQVRPSSIVGVITPGMPLPVSVSDSGRRCTGIPSRDGFHIVLPFSPESGVRGAQALDCVCNRAKYHCEQRRTRNTRVSTMLVVLDGGFAPGRERDDEERKSPSRSGQQATNIGLETNR